MKLDTLCFNYCRGSNTGFFTCKMLFFLLVLTLSLSVTGQESMLEQAKINQLRSQNGNKEQIDPNAPQGYTRVQIQGQATAQAAKVAQKQNPTLDRCGFVQAEEMIKEKYPNRPSIDQFEQWMKKAKYKVQSEGLRRNVVTIPVVVHVIDGGSINVSDAQVQSQIDALNEDFRRMNADASNTPSDFEGVASDVEIEFCLANVDPDGNPTNGINRYDGGQSSYSIADMENFIKPVTIWHPDFYFNIWCAPLPGGLLGYAQFPSNSTLDGFDEDEGPSFTDGIVTTEEAFGVGGTAVAPFNLGRTTTHEAGHFFGLRHIGGDGGCGVDDFCADTPTQNGQNNDMVGDCEYDPAAELGSSRNDCDDGEGDLPDQFMNYMDYSDDACMNMFSNDQKARMDVVLALSPRRASLVTSGVCNGIPPDYPYDPFENAPENDLCSGAIPIECGDEVSGSTELASPLEQPEACSPEPEARGVWYSIVGTGEGIQASLCGDTDYDSKIGVYSGTCGDLVCEAGDDDGCGGIGVPSEVEFETVEGETYFIFVTGWNGSTGNFTLSITCGVEPPMPPANDLCEGAVVVECGDVVEGTTINAIQDLSGTCVTSISAPGVWYNIVGEGEFITASLCEGTFYDAKIHIIEALDCDADLFCVTGNDDGCGIFGGPATATFLGEEGVNYYIYVNGFLGSVGDFTLTIECAPVAENDLCENAIALDCDSSIDGSTNFATDRDIVGDADCSDDIFSDLLGPGVWYTIVGTGGDINLSTCGTADFDTKIDVYTGECGDLTCYAGNEDGPGCSGFTSDLTFSSEEGVTYYVYISGYTSFFFGSSQGDFTLNVDCVCLADAGECATVYYGYDPAACTDLTASMLYGVGPYEYEWSNGMMSETITVCPSESTTYSVTITDAEGCVAVDDVYVDVIDVTCGNNGNKVEICHNGNKTLCISAEDIEDHLCHGDLLGACETVVICGEPFACQGESTENVIVDRRTVTNTDWSISPNPSTGLFQVKWSGELGEDIDIKVIDPAGKLIQSQYSIQLEDSSMNIDMSDVPAGVYYVRLNTNETVQMKKILLIK